MDGEPCCECESCLAVERGNSYDVHELDAASNNGVDAMRDLIEKASLGTPGRHRVYILDEVHMLSRRRRGGVAEDAGGAAAARRVRARHHRSAEGQRDHPQPHPAPAVPPAADGRARGAHPLAGRRRRHHARRAALQSVLRQGGGSARDTVSALEVVAASGGDVEDATPLDEFIEAMIEHDPGHALALVAAAVQQGREAAGLADDIVRHLRDCFLSLMAPELVQLPTARQEEVVGAGRAASVRRRSCGRWSASGRCSWRCATRPTRACCSRSPWCSSPTRRCRATAR